MKTYSFLDVLASLSGPGLVVNMSGQSSGADKSGIAISFNSPTNTQTIGADGSGMNTLMHDRSARITLTLVKSSPLNRVLSAAYNLQRANSALHGQNTFSLVDRNKGDKVMASGVAFEKAPDLSFGAEASPVQWTFTAIRADEVLG